MSPTPATTACRRLEQGRIPVNTPSRRNVRCSRPRGGRGSSGWKRPSSIRAPRPSAGPPVSRRKRSSSSRAIWAGSRCRQIAAASSMASGIPSSRRQISATARVPAPSRDSVGCTAQRPVHEETGHRRPVQHCTVQLIGRWSVKRRRPPRHLARNTEQLPTCREHGRRGIGSEHSGHELGAVSDEVLTVVQHEQRRFVAERDGDLHDNRSAEVVGCGQRRRGPPAPHHRPLSRRRARPTKRRREAVDRRRGDGDRTASCRRRRDR